MESQRDDIICKKFLENPSKNPRSGKTIKKDKDVYNNLVKLCQKRNFDVSSLNTKPVQIPIKKSFNKVWVPVQKQINIIDNKSPDDLLQLYLFDDTIILDSKKVIDDLNKKYKTNAETNSFMEWFKYYNYVNVPKNVKYLYMLENEQFIDSSYISKLNDETISYNMICILFDWMKETLSRGNLGPIYLNYCYACTLFYIIFSKKQSDINKGNLQIYGLIALYFSSIIIDENPLDMDDLKYLSLNAYTVEQLNICAIEVFNILSGQLIYPSPIFFVNPNEKNLISLTELAISIPEISIYKPSLVAHSCVYMLTGKHTIYTINEMNDICLIISGVLKRSMKSSLKTYKNRAINLIDKINKLCSEKLGTLHSQPLYKYNEPWHLGEFEEFENIGEGEYAKILKIKRKLCGKDYVSKISNGEDDNSLVKEISILKLLSGQTNIIQMCGFNYNINELKIILPLVKGSVWDLVTFNKLDKSKYNKYFHQILLGIEQCHNNDIIHRDIKPQNILYNEDDDNMLLIDMGISVCYQSFKNTANTDMANTLNYRPPEALIFNYNKYGPEIDVWSMGAVFYFMMTGTSFVNPDISNIGWKDVNKEFLKSIFNKLGSPTEQTWQGITDELKELDIAPSIPDPNLSKELYPFSDLILACLTLNPVDRPIIDELLISYKL